MIGSKVYDRHGDDTMSRHAYYAMIGVILTYGFIATFLVSEQTKDWQPGIFVLLLVGLGIPLAGIFISVSDNPFISFIGFNMVAIPFGAMLGPVMALYEVSDPGIVGEAALLTGCITAVMALSGFAFPKFYASIGGALFTALCCLVVVSVLSLFVPWLANLAFVHYIAATLFALYIGYDMYRASSIPATADNAVDVSISLYLDIINLFLRILASKRSS